MNNNKLYRVIEEIGTFPDEAAFKKKYMSIIDKDSKRYKTVLAIENAVEPGMPDLIVVDRKDKSYFIEVKYARKGVISFKKSQLPWYRRHIHLNIFILAYNDLTHNIHQINSSIILMKAQGTLFRLENETNYTTEYLL